MIKANLRGHHWEVPFSSVSTVHSRIQKFSSGGGGVQVSLTKESSDVFCFFLVLSLSYISQMVNFKERNLSFFKVPEWVQHFPGGGGGGPTFSRGGGGPIAYSL